MKMGYVLFAVFLVLAATAFAASDSFTFSAIGFKPVTVGATLTANIDPQNPTVCSGSPITISGGNTLTGTASAIYGSHTCYVRNMNTNPPSYVKTPACPTGITQLVDKWDRWPATFDPVRCTGDASVTNLNTPGYAIGSPTSTFSKPATPSSQTTYSNDVRATSCSFVAHVQAGSVRRNDGCCDLAYDYLNRAGYVTGGGADPRYTYTTAGDWTFTGTPSNLIASAPTTVSVAAKDTLSIQMGSISYTGLPNPKTNDIVSYSFTLTNPTNYPVTVACTYTPGAGTVVDMAPTCPLGQLAAHGTTTVTGRIKITAPCNTNLNSLGQLGITYNVVGQACIDKTTISISPLLTTFSTPACANICPAAPTITCNPASPKIPIPGASISTSCTALTTDPDNKPGPLKYIWTSPESRTDGAATQAFTFTTSGLKTITAYGNDGNVSCTNAATVYVNVTPPDNRPPVVNFTAPATVCVNTAVNFVGSATDPDPGDTISSYLWNFGDGTSVNGPGYQTVTKSYTIANTYSVTFAASDNHGLGGLITKSVQVLPSSAAQCFTNRAPIAVMSGPATTCVGNSTSFSSAGSSDPDGQTITYAWTFGDGSTSTAANPAHTYASAGAMLVNVIVTDSYTPPMSASANKSVSVRDANPSTGLAMCDRAPVAIINGPYIGVPGMAVSFTAAGSYDPDPGQTALLKYKWDFGDGTVSALLSTPTTTHNYTVTGTYVVRLNVTDPWGLKGYNTTTADLTTAAPMCTCVSPITPTPITNRAVSITWSYAPTTPTPANATLLCDGGAVPPLSIACLNGNCGPASCTYTSTGAKTAQLSIPKWLTIPNAGGADCDCNFNVEPGASCTTSATQINNALTPDDTATSNVTIAYVRLAAKPTSVSVICGANGALVSASCDPNPTYNTSSMLWSGTCSALCTYGPLAEGTYTEVIQSSLGTVACTDSAPLTIKVGPECKDYI